VVDAREKQIKDLFAKGHFVGFRRGPFFKVANAWNINEGVDPKTGLQFLDLIGVYSNGMTKAIFWESPEYVIEDLGPDWKEP
jgi:hypothetical protein